MEMESLRWCSDFLNEICQVSHFFMRGDELVDLTPKPEIQASMNPRLALTSETDQETQPKSDGTFRALAWFGFCTLLCCGVIYCCLHNSYRL